MNLLLDIGNSRIKWALRACVGAPLEAGPALAHDGDPARALSRLSAQASTPIRSVGISHVLGAAGEQALRAAVTAAFGLEPWFARSATQAQGLRNAYHEPERLGVDRWLAMLGAWTQAAQACVVADAGTALTVDLIDAQGQHQGGLIAPGLMTAHTALLGATRFPTRYFEQTGQAGLGRDTETCVRQGVLQSVLGAIDRATALAPADATCIITGGDAATLLPSLDQRWAHRPLLVLEGLAAAQDSADGSR